MAASVTQICNRALQLLGAKRIQSITDQSVNARACLLCYDVLRDKLLRTHRWSFAIQRFQLAASATVPLFGYANAYPLPTGWLLLLDPDPIQNFQDRDWIIEGNSILTNWVPPLNVKCVMKVEDTTLMDPAFREALSALMAGNMCEELTQSNEKKKDAFAAYKEAIADARKANAIEQVPQLAVEDEWIITRVNGFSGTTGAGGWS